MARRTFVRVAEPREAPAGTGCPGRPRCVARRKQRPQIAQIAAKSRNVPCGLSSPAACPLRPGMSPAATCPLRPPPSGSGPTWAIVLMTHREAASRGQSSACGGICGSASEPQPPVRSREECPLMVSPRLGLDPSGGSTAWVGCDDPAEVGLRSSGHSCRRRFHPAARLRSRAATSWRDRCVTRCPGIPSRPPSRSPFLAPGRSSRFRRPTSLPSWPLFMGGFVRPSRCDLATAAPDSHPPGLLVPRYVPSATDRKATALRTP